MPEPKGTVAAAQELAEREPAPRRGVWYNGDVTATFAESKHYLGPDRRGIVWTPCHCEYDVSVGKTRVIFRPVSKEELGEVYQRWQQKK